MESLYQNPYYYELAFSFRDIAHEVDVFEAGIERFSGTPVHGVLEVACGNAPHAGELVRRGYRYAGIDTSDAMLAYSRRKTAALGPAVQLIHADMVDFSLDARADFAYVMLGSFYVSTTAELASHFDAMARALTAGGLYFLDWCVQFQPPYDEKEFWEVGVDGIHIKVDYRAETVNCLDQTFAETISLDVDDHGACRQFVQVCTRRAVFPQEFLNFIEHRSDFEFVGWWNDWDLSRPITGFEAHISRPVTIVRRI